MPLKSWSYIQSFPGKILYVKRSSSDKGGLDYPKESLAYSL